MKVSGEVLLFKNDFGYSASISNKKQDGTYEYMNYVVQFRRDDMDAQKIPNKTKINIKDGFLTFYKSTGNEKKLKVVVLDYEILGEGAPQNKNEEYEDPFPMESGEIFGTVDDDDLPF